MLFSYFITAYRSLKNRPVLTGINVVGLAVGLAACLLISLWVRHQLSYDTFHPKADDVYRVVLEAQMPNGSIAAPVTPAPMAPTLHRDVPEVEAATRFTDRSEMVVRVGDRPFVERRVFEADSAFFDVFGGFEVIRGNPETVLDASDAVVLTRSTAQRYFGDLDVVGKTVEVDATTRRVTGVVEDVPANAHFHYDLLIPIDLPPDLRGNWTSNGFSTYVRLTERHDRAAFAQKLQDFVEQYVGPQMSEGLGIPVEQWLAESRFHYRPQALLDVYLHSNLQYEIEPTGSIAYVWTFSAIALFILVIACINFVNLVTARATERAEEVGMRKALGALRGQLAGQFLGEAFLTTVSAGVVALGLASFALPTFNQMAGTDLDLVGALAGPMGAMLLGGVVLVSIGAGGYPALVLSGFSPASVLRSAGTSHTGGSGKWLRQSLVVVQFAISITLIAGTLVVWNQFEYIQTKRLGLDKEHVVAIERSQGLDEQQEAFKREVRALPGVAGVGASNTLFDQGVNNFHFQPDDRPAGEGVTLSTFAVDHRFTDVMDIEVVKGRTFDPARSTDTSAVIINQAAARILGWDQPTEHVLHPGQDEPPLSVIGVVEDFHFQSLRRSISPLLLEFSPSPDQVLVRIHPGDASETMTAIEDTWSQFVPGTPMSFTSLDDRFASLHADTQRTARLFVVFAVLAIAIACFGLFGLATYTAQRRTKEIGIRKALGATAGQIVRLLSRDFMTLVTVAFVVATPLAYVGMQRWLRDFAYHADVGVGVFAGAGFVAFVIAFLTVSIQAFRAAQTDPAAALRSE